MNGTVFKMYKFRSMKLNAPDIRNEDGSTFTIKTDDGSELSIMDYVADWSKDNPEFVKVETKGGSGTGLFDKAGGGNKAPQSDADKFMADILATAKPVETKSLGEAFGGR